MTNFQRLTKFLQTCPTKVDLYPELKDDLQLMIDPANRGIIISNISQMLPGFLILVSSPIDSFTKELIPLFKVFADIVSDNISLKTEEWWHDLEHNIVPKKVVPYLTALLEKNGDYWAEIWVFAVNLLFSGSRSSGNSLNCLLKIIEMAFKKSAENDKGTILSRTFSCWKQFIEIFAKHQKFMRTDKMIGLFIRPQATLMGPRAHFYKLEIHKILFEKFGNLEEEAQEVFKLFFEQSFYKNENSMCKTCPNECCEIIVLLLSGNRAKSSYILPLLSVYNICFESKPKEVILIKIWKILMDCSKSIERITFFQYLEKLTFQRNCVLRNTKLLEKYPKLQDFISKSKLPLITPEILHEGLLTRKISPKLLAELLHWKSYRLLTLPSYFDQYLNNVYLNVDKKDTALCATYLVVWDSLCVAFKKNIDSNGYQFHEYDATLFKSLILFPLKSHAQWAGTTQTTWHTLTVSVGNIGQLKSIIPDIVSTLNQNVEENNISIAAAIDIMSHLVNIDKTAEVTSTLDKILARLPNDDPINAVDLCAFVETLIGNPDRKQCLSGVLSELLRLCSSFDQLYEHKIKTKVSKLHRKLIHDSKPEIKQKIDETPSPKLRSPLMSGSNFLHRLARSEEKKVKTSPVQLDRNSKYSMSPNNESPEVTTQKESIHEILLPASVNMVVNDHSVAKTVNGKTEKPDQINGNLPNEDSKQTVSMKAANKKKISYFENDSQEFVVVPPKPKINTPLTEHQKEILQRKSIIPAMYQDLSQDTQSQSVSNLMDQKTVNILITSPTPENLEENNELEEKAEENEDKNASVEIIEETQLVDDEKTSQNNPAAVIEVTPPVSTVTPQVTGTKSCSTSTASKKLNFEGLLKSCSPVSREKLENKNVSSQENSPSPTSRRMSHRKTTSKYGANRVLYPSEGSNDSWTSSKEGSQVVDRSNEDSKAGEKEKLVKVKGSSEKEVKNKKSFNKQGKYENPGEDAKSNVITDAIQTSKKQSSKKSKVSSLNKIEDMNDSKVKSDTKSTRNTEKKDRRGKQQYDIEKTPKASIGEKELNATSTSDTSVKENIKKENAAAARDTIKNGVSAAANKTKSVSEKDRTTDVADSSAKTANGSKEITDSRNVKSDKMVAGKLTFNISSVIEPKKSESMSEIVEPNSQPKESRSIENDLQENNAPVSGKMKSNPAENAEIDSESSTVINNLLKDLTTPPVQNKKVRGRPRKSTPRMFNFSLKRKDKCANPTPPEKETPVCDEIGSNRRTQFSPKLLRSKRLSLPTNAKSRGSPKIRAPKLNIEILSSDSNDSLSGIKPLDNKDGQTTVPVLPNDDPLNNQAVEDVKKLTVTESEKLEQNNVEIDEENVKLPEKVESKEKNSRKRKLQSKSGEDCSKVENEDSGNNKVVAKRKKRKRIFSKIKSHSVNVSSGLDHWLYKKDKDVSVTSPAVEKYKKQPDQNGESCLNNNKLSVEETIGDRDDGFPLEQPLTEPLKTQELDREDVSSDDNHFSDSGSMEPDEPSPSCLADTEIITDELSSANPTLTDLASTQQSQDIFSSSLGTNESKTVDSLQEMEPTSNENASATDIPLSPSVSKVEKLENGMNTCDLIFKGWEIEEKIVIYMEQPVFTKPDEISECENNADLTKSTECNSINDSTNLTSVNADSNESVDQATEVSTTMISNSDLGVNSLENVENNENSSRVDHAKLAEVENEVMDVSDKDINSESLMALVEKDVILVSDEINEDKEINVEAKEASNLENTVEECDHVLAEVSEQDIKETTSADENNQSVGKETITVLPSDSQYDSDNVFTNDTPMKRGIRIIHVTENDEDGGDTAEDRKKRSNRARRFHFDDLSLLARSSSRSKHMIELAQQGHNSRTNMSKRRANISPITYGANWPTGPSEDWVGSRPTTPALCMSPSILKPSSTISTSSPPPAKKKRVNFLDPPVSTGLLYEKGKIGIGQLHFADTSPGRAHSRISNNIEAEIDEKQIETDTNFDEEQRNEIIAEESGTMIDIHEDKPPSENISPVQNNGSDIHMEDAAEVEAGNELVSGAVQSDDADVADDGEPAHFAIPSYDQLKLYYENDKFLQTLTKVVHDAGRDSGEWASKFYRFLDAHRQQK